LDFKGLSKQIKFQPNGEVAGSVIYMYEVKSSKIGLLGDVSQLVGG
jgi:branched-chain amino acid transport system substrate-binding protein